MSAQRFRSVTKPADRPRTSDPARQTAYLTLRAVAHGAYANLELPGQVRTAGLSGRDAAFATELTYGTIRMQGLYDSIIAIAADRDPAHIDAAVREILRMGAHQLLAMRVPDHAAVSATVALARQNVSQGSGGFVNAVLRRVSERDRSQWLEAVTDGVGDPIARLAVLHSHPVWIVRALRAALLTHAVSTSESIETDLADLLAAHNTPGTLTLTARPGLNAEADLESSGATKSPTASSAWRLPHGDPGSIAAIRDGRAAVQDAGSQLVALALLEASVDKDEGRWLDLCAGPGGKAGLLAAAARQRGATLHANEVSEHRASLVRQTLRGAIAAGADVEVSVGDGTDIGADQPDHFDRVLVDAPCTGLGALRRRPEARWRRQPSDLSDLAPLQRRLLASAVQATRPGGVVVYATCSPHIAETTLVVEDVARRHDCVVEDIRPLLCTREAEPFTDLGPGPGAQLWPHIHDTDGMFMSLLRRTWSGLTRSG